MSPRLAGGSGTAGCCRSAILGRTVRGGSSIRGKKRSTQRGGGWMGAAGCATLIHTLCGLYGEYGLILSIVNAGENPLRAVPLGRAVPILALRP